ncbi:hypothetical protein BOX15_Mlig033934g1 [Macrostomum lignano]|uniref:Uncharacterized protein n=1 Tax=Macrostomum lignano TaxID=282301 RepID=A0A267DWT5_9PLAT|nr:hypothetical protein BOX15_Mlig033934g1 [Macrostomum lignano]
MQTKVNPTRTGNSRSLPGSRLPLLLLLVLLAVFLCLSSYAPKLSIYQISFPVFNTDDDFADSFARVLQRQQSGRCLHEFNSSLKLPLLRLDSPAELDPKIRTRAAAAWLRSSVDVVFAASVRNAMRGLPGTAQQMRRLADSFRSVAFVFVENDSADDTRRFLTDWRRRDARVRLLGCGGADAACRMNISYSSGRAHRQGWSLPRNQVENRERGIVMSALRNIYLRHIYRQLYRPDRDSLLIVVDPDLSFKPWDLDAILQGLYYFRDRPELQSLCAHTTSHDVIYDNCTLVFQRTRLFSQVSRESTIVSDFNTTAQPPGLPPVKVAGCFQAFTAYRLSHLAEQKLEYGPARGETVCEHLTLARQLMENYLDLGKEVVKENEGGL